MLMNYLERKITKWIRNKFMISLLKESYSKLKSIKQAKPILFYHWEKGYCKS